MKRKCIKRIEVLDGYIKIDLLSCSHKLDDFVKTLEETADRLEAGEEGLDADEARRMLAKKFDIIFGYGACRKTFQTSIPGMGQFEEFWSKFEPLLVGWLKGIGP